MPANASIVTKGLLAAIDSSGNAINATTQRPVLGVFLNTTTTTPGVAVIATTGRVNCTFTGTFGVGDYVTLGSSGMCASAGSTYSSSVQLIGTVLDTSGNILLRIGN